MSKASGVKVLFVSPCGDNRWTGQLADPRADRQDGPFATPGRAVSAAAELRKAGVSRAAVRIQLRGGCYPLAKPLVVTAALSGTAEHPLTIESFPGERAVLSGGRRIEGWSEGTHSGQRVWTAPLPDVAAGRWHFTQLFVNGMRRLRTRLPRVGCYRFRDVPKDAVAEMDASAYVAGPNAAIFSDTDIQRWKNLDDVRLMVPQLWFDVHHRIRAVDPRRHRVAFCERHLGTLKDDEDMATHARYWVENVFEAMEEPGDWYLDRRAGKLYYLPLPGETLATTEVIAPRLETLVRLAGTAAHPVRHVRFENIAFQHAEWAYPPGDLGSIQAAFRVPGAVRFDNAEECVLYGCEVAHVAQYGVEMNTGCSGNQIVACAIHDLGAGGVKIGHEWLERKDLTSPRAIKRRPQTKRMAAVVSDCSLHDGGLMFPSAIGIWIGNSGGNQIRHNHIFNFNYTGISCGWTWGYAPTATRDNRIENNHIHHINWNRLLSDNGGIYTLGMHPGTVIRNNHIHHIGRYQYGGWGIYPDEGSSEILFENNLVHDTDEAGFSTHYGRDNLVRNNIFALSGKTHVHPGRREGHRTTVFERNIVSWRGGGLAAHTWRPEHFLFRDNLLWNGGGLLECGDELTFADWQQIGQHVGTLLVDPLLVDPAGGDFSLRADSPALRLGFRPLIPSQIGPRTRSSRPRSFADWPQEREERRPVVRTRLESAGLGAFRVTVENVGDASASGRLAFRACPREAAKLSRSAAFAFRNLLPGTTQSTEIPFKLSATAKTVWVETVPASKDLLPTLQFLRVRATEWRVPRLAPLSTPEQVTSALAGQAPLLAATLKGKVVARFRAAVAGDKLALLATVVDPAPSRGTPVWAGSCLEVFTRGNDNPLRGRRSGRARVRNEIRQSFLMPAIADESAQGAYQDGLAFCPTADIRVSSKPTADGYELAALLPLALLNVAPESERFLLELRLFTRLTAGGGLRQFPLFNAPAPHGSAEGYATVIVGP